MRRWRRPIRFGRTAARFAAGRPGLIGAVLAAIVILPLAALRGEVNLVVAAGAVLAVTLGALLPVRRTVSPETAEAAPVDFGADLEAIQACPDPVILVDRRTLVVAANPGLARHPARAQAA